MRYDEEVEREIRLEEQDFVNLFRDQEAIDGGTRLHIKKLDFLRALGQLDPMSQLTLEEQEELEEEYGTPNSPSDIKVEEMESDYAQEDLDQLLHNLSISGEYTLESIKESHGEWAVERMREHEKVMYSPECKSFAWDGDEVYEYE